MKVNLWDKELRIDFVGCGGFGLVYCEGGKWDRGVWILWSC